MAHFNDDTVSPFASPFVKVASFVDPRLSPLVNPFVNSGQQVIDDRAAGSRRRSNSYGGYVSHRYRQVHTQEHGSDKQSSWLDMRLKEHGNDKESSWSDIALKEHGNDKQSSWSDMYLKEHGNDKRSSWSDMHLMDGLRTPEQWLKHAGVKSTCVSPLHAGCMTAPPDLWPDTDDEFEPKQKGKQVSPNTTTTTAARLPLTLMKLNNSMATEDTWPDTDDEDMYGPRSRQHSKTVELQTDARPVYSSPRPSTKSKNTQPQNAREKFLDLLQARFASDPETTQLVEPVPAVKTGRASALGCVPRFPIFDAGAARQGVVVQLSDKIGVSCEAPDTTDPKPLIQVFSIQDALSEQSKRLAVQVEKPPAVNCSRSANTCWSSEGAAGRSANSCWSSEGAADSVAAEEDGKQRRTTLMIRNLPTDLGQRRLIEELDISGFENKFDFCYMPSCFSTGCGRGFAFVNFLSEQLAGEFIAVWRGSHRFGMPFTEPGLNISFAAIQGLAANMNKWNTSRIRRVKNPNLRPYLRADCKH